MAGTAPQGSEWGLPILYLVASRGGCMERGVLALQLGVTIAALRRMVWGLQRRGLVAASGERVCVTPSGLSLLEGLRGAARKRNHFVIVINGNAYLVSVRNRGARAYVLSRRQLCSVLGASGSAADTREVARLTGLAPKTVSYTMKALGIMGCPGPGCLLDVLGFCGQRGDGERREDTDKALPANH